MILRDETEIYPLRQRKITLGGVVVYDRNTRGESWFVVDLVLHEGLLMTSDGEALITSDRKRLKTQSRHRTPERI